MTAHAPTGNLPISNHISLPMGGRREWNCKVLVDRLPPARQAEIHGNWVPEIQNDEDHLTSEVCGHFRSEYPGRPARSLVVGQFQLTHYRNSIPRGIDSADWMYARFYDSGSRGRFGGLYDRSSLILSPSAFSPPANALSSISIVYIDRLYRGVQFVWRRRGHSPQVVESGTLLQSAAGARRHSGDRLLHSNDKRIYAGESRGISSGACNASALLVTALRISRDGSPFQSDDPSAIPKRCATSGHL